MQSGLLSFHSIHGSQIQLSNNNHTATRVDAEKVYDNGVVYAGIPFSGHSRFVVEANELGVGWSGSFKLGVVLLSPDNFKQGYKPPRYSPGSDHDSWVWSRNLLHIGSEVKVPYGFINLEEVEKGDRLGIEVSEDGVVRYLVNGAGQGVVAQNIYTTHDHVMGFIDHYGQAVTSTVVDAFVSPFSLQHLCRKVIYRRLKHDMRALSEYLPQPLLHYVLAICIKDTPHDDQSDGAKATK